MQYSINLHEMQLVDAEHHIVYNDSRNLVLCPPKRNDVSLLQNDVDRKQNDVVSFRTQTQKMKPILKPDFLYALTQNSSYFIRSLSRSKYLHGYMYAISLYFDKEIYKNSSPLIEILSSPLELIEKSLLHR